MSKDTLANTLLVLAYVLLCLTGIRPLMMTVEGLLQERFPRYDGGVVTLVALMGGLAGLLFLSVWLKARANHTRIGEYFDLARRREPVIPPETGQKDSGV